MSGVSTALVGVDKTQCNGYFKLFFAENCVIGDFTICTFRQCYCNYQIKDN